MTPFVVVGLLLAVAACWLLIRRRRACPPARLPGTFRDGAGRLWHVHIDVATLRRVKEHTGLNLTDLVCAQPHQAENDCLVRLLADPVLLVDVLYLVCLPEVEQRELSDQDFGRALAGDSLAEAIDALLDGLIAFFPRRRDRRRLSAQVAATRKLLDQADGVLDNLADPAETERLIHQALMHSHWPTSSPESAAPTPRG